MYRALKLRLYVVDVCWDYKIEEQGSFLTEIFLKQLLCVASRGISYTEVL